LGILLNNDMPGALNLINRRFDKLVVINRVENNKHGGTCWLCKCDCGKEKIISANNLLGGGSKSCGYHRLSKDLVGEKFGHLIVLKRENNSTNKRRTIWLCRCICGKEKSIRGDSLRKGDTLSCGCLHPRKPHTDPTTPKISSAKSVWRASYKDGNLTFEEFYNISQQLCYYCGAVPSNKSNIFTRGTKPTNSTQFSKDNGTFIYNGLDRIDNNLPHNIDNIVPCCYPCNWSKSDRTKQDFEKWALDVVVQLCHRDISKLSELHTKLKYQ
jgi:hypothetical protein